MFRVRRLAGFAMAASLTATAAFADVIHVPGDQPSLAAAVKVAADGDEIVLADGVWSDGNFGLTLRGKALTLRSANGPAACIIDCRYAARWLDIKGEATAGTVIQGLTIHAAGAFGLRGEKTNVTIRDCIFTKCHYPCVQLINCTGVITDTRVVGAFSGSVRETNLTRAVTADGDISVARCTFEANQGGALGLEGSRAVVEASVFRGNKGSVTGGGLAVSSESTLIRDCAFSDNESDDGAALFCSNRDGSLVMERCRFLANRALVPLPSGGHIVRIAAREVSVVDCDFSQNDGYAAGLEGRVTVTGCNFTSNSGVGLYVHSGDRFTGSHLTAVKNQRSGLVLNSRVEFAHITDSVFKANGHSGNDDAGSGIRVYAEDALLERCLFEGNRGASGGGISGGGRFELRDCILRENLASNRGGAVTGGTVRLVNSTLTGNHAGAHGGAASCGRLEVAGCVFRGNTAEGGGGALYLNNGQIHCTNSVMYGNAAASESGGALFVEAGLVTLHNSILWDNDAPVGPQIGFGRTATLTATFNDVMGGREGIWAPQGDFRIHWRESNLDVDPRFTDAEAGDFRLMPGSPCIDAGNNRAIPDFVATDADGRVRFHDDPDTPDTGRGTPPLADIGAYEFAAPPVCTDAETLRARCTPVENGFAVTAKVRGARPGARVTLTAEGSVDEPVVRQINTGGRARAVFHVETEGPVAVHLIECDIRIGTRCKS